MARKTKKKLSLDLEGQPAPTTPLDWQQFLAAAAPVMKTLKDDLRARAKSSPSVAEALHARHEAEKDEKRTADSFVEWQDHFVEQVAAAWMLSCVFVRTLEDRGLLANPTRFVQNPQGERNRVRRHHRERGDSRARVVCSRPECSGLVTVRRSAAPVSGSSSTFLVTR